jgi:Rrf2 family protein
MLHLTGLPPGARASLTELAETTEVPPPFLYKVLRQLTARGLVIAHRGKRGGFESAATLRPMTVLDVVLALEGLPAVNVCVIDGGCHRSPSCPAHPVWVEAQARMREVLAAASLESLVARSREHLPVTATTRPAMPPCGAGGRRTTAGRGRVRRRARAAPVLEA